MKNREVKAMLFAMAFSAATMTSCGAYGSMEEYDPSMSEESAVYGSFEVMDTEYEYSNDQEDLPAPERYWNWEDSKLQRNGYDGETVREVEYDGILLNIPSYMQEEASEDPDTLSFTAEESDTDFASLTISHERYEIPSGNGDCMAVVDEIVAGLIEEETSVDNVSVPAGAANTEAWIITSYEEINGEQVITYDAYMGLWISDTETDIIRMTFRTTGGCDYSYRDDFTAIIENSVRRD